MGDVGYLKYQLWYGNKTIHYHYHHYHYQLSLVNTILFWQTKQRNKISMIFCSWAMATWFDKQIAKDIRSVWYFAHGQWQFDGFPWRPIAVPALQRHQVRVVKNVNLYLQWMEITLKICLNNTHLSLVIIQKILWKCPNIFLISWNGIIFHFELIFRNLLFLLI